MVETVSLEKLDAWLDAVRATERAVVAQTRAAWSAAARAWDALVRLHAPTEPDRDIYKTLAVQAWMQAADWRTWR